jgi:heptaprenyl diphosphate synthase
MKKNSMKKTEYIALMGMLLCLAVILSAAENAVVPVLPLGIKPGLSNIAIMAALIYFDGKSALTLAAMKSGFVFLTRSVMAGLMSLSGGIISAIVMLVLFKKTKSSLILTSVLGAVAHNLAQLLCSALITQSSYTLWYYPVLILTGTAAGALTGVVLSVVMPYLKNHFRKEWK